MAVNTALVIGLVLLFPASLMFSGSVVLFCREKSGGSFLQLVGAGCLAIVVLCHLSKALHLFPWMPWGLEPSFRHYLAFLSAVLCLTAFTIGYLFYPLT